MEKPCCLFRAVGLATKADNLDSEIGPAEIWDMFSRNVKIAGIRQDGKAGNYQDEVSWKILEPQRAVPVSDKTERAASAILVAEKQRKPIAEMQSTSCLHCELAG